MVEKKYSFNDFNLSQLTQFLDISELKLTKILNMHASPGAYKLHHNTLSCAEMLTLCRETHVPLRCFIKVNDKAVRLCKVEHYSEPTDNLAFFCYLTTANTNVTSVIEKLGISSLRWYSVMEDFANRVPFKVLLEWCSQLKQNVGDYIVDGNMEIPKIFPVTTIPDTQELLSNLRFLSEANKVLKQQNTQFKRLVTGVKNLTELAVKHQKSDAGRAVVRRVKGAFAAVDGSDTEGADKTLLADYGKWHDTEADKISMRVMLKEQRRIGSINQKLKEENAAYWRYVADMKTLLDMFYGIEDAQGILKECLQSKTAGTEH